MFLRRLRASLSLLLTGFLLVGASVGAAPASAAEPPGWSQEELAPAGVSIAHLGDVELRRARDGRLIALAVRSSVDFSSVGLTFLQRKPVAGAMWTRLAITSHSDISPSMALSATGAVHAAFVRQGSGIRYTSNRTGTWVVEVVPGSMRAEAPSVALTNGGTPSVAFSAFLSRSSYLLRIASKTAAGWTVRTIATGDVGQPSLKIDALHKRHLVYVRRSGTAPGLYYATDRTGSWQTTRLTSATDVEWPRLVLDSARHVHVAYVRSVPGFSRVLYVTNATGRWVTSTASAPAGGSSPEIGLDAAGRPVIAYTAARSSEGGPAWMAERVGSGWVRSRATEDLIAGRPGLAIDGASLHLVALRPFADANGAGQLIHAQR
jgi:hypothetical protein